MTEKNTVTLDHPVTVDGKVYDNLTFDKFRTKHFRYLPDEIYEMFVTQDEVKKPKEGEAPEAEVEETREQKIKSMKLGFQMIPLVAAICNVSEKVLDELEIDDTMKVMGAFNDFLSESSLLTDGKK